MKKLLNFFFKQLSQSKIEFLKIFSLRFLTYLSRLSYNVSSVPHENYLEDRAFNDKSLETFALDKNSCFEIFNIEAAEFREITWGHSDSTYNKYIGVLLRNEDVLQIRKPILFRNSWIRLSFSPTFQSSTQSHGTLVLSLTNSHGEVSELASFNTQNKKWNAEWSTFEVDLQRFDGECGSLQLVFKLERPQLLNEAISMPNFSIIVSKLTVGPKLKLNLIEARTFQGVRIQNEVGHFSEVYEHKMYESTQFLDQPFSILRLEDAQIIDPLVKIPPFETFPPLEGESVYGYASRLLDLNLKSKSIDFEERLKTLSLRKQPLKVLSLCSGSARTEAKFDEITQHTCHWTLQDLNENLLRKARRQFSPESNIEFLVGDVNQIFQTDSRWDIIMCVSGLHHVVELENVINFISESLTTDGEFWLIGEYVGKSGNRLQPSAQIEADRIFSTLPPKYRFNQHLKEVDKTLPRNDYSIDCFEGIRADEIEAIIAARFYPSEIVRNNAFLWRLVNLAYADNYDLSIEDDLRVIERLVESEVTHFKKHLGGTSLNAIYSKIY